MCVCYLDKVFNWIDGTPITLDKWAAGEPRNAQKCALMQYCLGDYCSSQSSRILSVSCDSARYSYFCATPPGMCVCLYFLSLLMFSSSSVLQYLVPTASVASRTASATRFFKVACGCPTLPHDLVATIWAVCLRCRKRRNCMQNCLCGWCIVVGI